MPVTVTEQKKKKCLYQSHTWSTHNITAYQILKLNEDDFSVGAQDFFIVTSTFTTRAGQQENHQDNTE